MIRLVLPAPGEAMTLTASTPAAWKRCRFWAAITSLTASKFWPILQGLDRHDSISMLSISISVPSSVTWPTTPHVGQLKVSPTGL